MPGQRGETTGVTALMEGVSCGAFPGDKAYDADWLREMLSTRGIEPVIPARKGRKHPAPHDEEKYRWRHLVENYFRKLKEFKTHSHAVRQNRPKLLCDDLYLRCNHKRTVNLNTPYPVHL